MRDDHFSSRIALEATNDFRPISRGGKGHLSGKFRMLPSGCVIARGVAGTSLRRRPSGVSLRRRRWQRDGRLRRRPSNTTGREGRLRTDYGVWGNDRYQARLVRVEYVRTWADSVR
jgi:hypothetical protein